VCHFTPDPINRLDQGNAAPPVPAVADGRGIALDRVDEIFEQRLAAEVAHYGGRRTLILIRRGSLAKPGRWIPQVGRQDAILVENDGALRSSQFHTPRISRICGGGGLKETERAVRKLQDRECRVLRFNLM